MSDDKSSRNVFAQAGKPTITNPDGSPLRNKDSAAPELKPTHARTNNPHLAPMGSMGIRTSQPTRQTPAPAQTNEQAQSNMAGLSKDHTLFSDDARYTDGKILTMPGYTFMARMTDEPSKTGLDGGRIEQLVVRKDDKPVAVYNHGWTRDPETPEAKEAVHRVRNGLEPNQQKDFQGFDPGKTKGQTHER